MIDIDFLFMGLLKFLVLSFLLLGAGLVLMKWIRQPSERISLIQLSMVSVVLAVVISWTGLVPEMRLAVLPAGSKAIASPVTDDNQMVGSLPGELRMSQFPYAGDVTEAGSIGEFSTDPESASAESGSTPFERAPTHREGNVSGDVLQKAPKGVLPWVAIGMSVFTGIFAIGSLYHLLLLILGYVATGRMIRDLVPLPQQDLARIRAMLSEVAGESIEHVRVAGVQGNPMPMVHGILAPTIMLPVDLTRADADPHLVRHCLAHEWKHLQRGDLKTWTLVSCLQTVLWMQPFFWKLRSELRVCQDQLADNFAVEADGRRADYAETLLKFANLNQRSLMGALTMAGTQSNLYRRVEMLLNDRFRVLTGSRRRVVAGLSAAMIVGVVGLASMQLVHAGLSDSSNHGWVQDDDSRAQEKTDQDADQATESVEHVGVVRHNETGEPLPGTLVNVRRESTEAGKRDLLRETHHTTDENGEFKFSLEPEELNNRYLYIELDVEHADMTPQKGFGYSYTMIKKNLKFGEPPFFEETKLHPAEPVMGRVVDEQGNPLESVEIVGYSTPAQSDDQAVMGSFDRTRTNADGNFKMNFYKGGISIIWVRPASHEMKQIMTGLKRGDLGDIVVKSGIQIHGQILDALGKPVEGAFVNLEDLDAQAEIQIPVSSALQRFTRTDESGNYRFAPVRSGQYQLKVVDRGPQINASGKKEWIDVELDSVFAAQRIDIDNESVSHSHDVMALPHVYVKGNFINSKGEATSGHLPSLMGKVNGSYMFFEAKRGEKKGEFFVRVPHGTQDARISFVTNEHSSLKVKLRDSDWAMKTHDIEIGDIEEDLDTIQVMRFVAPILQVNVVDEDGNPLESAQVGALYQKEGSQEFNLLSGITTGVFFSKSADGVFRSSSLAPDSEFTFFAELEGYERAEASLSLEEKEAHQATLKLVRAKDSSSEAREDKDAMKDSGTKDR